MGAKGLQIELHLQFQYSICNCNLSQGRAQLSVIERSRGKIYKTIGALGKSPENLKNLQLNMLKGGVRTL